jgi:hypothetical protein
MTRAAKQGKLRFLRVRWLAALLLGSLLSLQVPVPRAETIIGPEYAVKIGFIYNFANFVAWPAEVFESHPDELFFCYVADSPSSEIFLQLDGKRIRGRTIRVTAYQGGACLDTSQILFFATQDKTLIQQVLDQAQGRSILTIGEVEGFSRMGGIINFFEEQSRLRFKINIDAARREKLWMSSQLLGSARIVREEKP